MTLGIPNSPKPALPIYSWNKYTQVASRALRQALTETERVGAERRAQIGVRYQIWQGGQGQEVVSFSMLLDVSGFWDLGMKGVAGSLLFVRG